nr:hypothetical protein [Tanacetum cinerariifolium]
MMKFCDGKMCIQNGYWGTKLYLFDGNKAIYEDEYNDVEEFRQSLFANQPSEQSEITPRKYLLLPKTLQMILLSTSILYETLLSYWMWNSFLLCCWGAQSVIVGNVIAIQEDEGFGVATPNEKQKTNKRHVEGEPGSESSTGKKNAVEIKVKKMLERTGNAGSGAGI